MKIRDGMEDGWAGGHAGPGRDGMESQSTDAEHLRRIASLPPLLRRVLLLGGVLKDFGEYSFSSGDRGRKSDGRLDRFV